MIASPVVHLLATELSNYRHTVRSTAKRAIELMAAAKGCSTTDILAPCREAVETHIFSKQLRAVQVCGREGNCLSRRWVELLRGVSPNLVVAW